jgi:hypothetical protein
METTLYYTFSTIAQTLAGAIALLGAFILYRLQKLNNGLDDHAKFIRKQYSEEEDLVFLNSFIVKGEYKKFLKYTKVKPVSAFTDPAPYSTEDGQSYLTDVQAKMRELLALRKSFIRSFTVSLFLTVSLIASSVVALAITPSLNSRNNLRTGSLSLAIVWFLACLISYVSLLRKSLF